MTEPSKAAEQHRLLDEARIRKLGKLTDRQAEAKRDVLLYGNRLFPGFPPATGRQALTLAIVGALILAAIVAAIVI
jgi:hypothetical protein